jgi:predicted nucleotidyltransferase
MGRWQVICEHKAEIQKMTHRYGVHRLGVFGSTARGDDTEKSDIDFIIEWPAPHSLFDRMDLAGELSDLLGAPVDLILAPRLHASIKQKILGETVWL